MVVAVGVNIVGGAVLSRLDGLAVEMEGKGWIDVAVPIRLVEEGMKPEERGLSGESQRASWRWDVLVVSPVSSVGFKVELSRFRIRIRIELRFCEALPPGACFACGACHAVGG
jgi:hypothetical protein